MGLVHTLTYSLVVVNLEGLADVEYTLLLADAETEGLFYADFDMERAYRLLADLKIDPKAQLKTLSKGTKEKVQLILVMSRNAKLYLLDGMSHRDTVSKLGGGFPAEKCTQKAEKLKIENIETLISLCQECDMKTKNGLLGGWAALETIVAEYRFY